MTDRAPLDLDRFLDLPRVQGLAVSPDGRRVVAEVAVADLDAGRFVSSLWAVDPDDSLPPQRLTRSAAGESSPRFAPDGSLLFTSSRGAGEGDDPRSEGTPGLWRLPDGPGEPVALAEPPAGVDGFAVARGSGRVVIGAGTHPGAEGFEDDAELERARSAAKVSAQLLSHHPIRFWDRWLGPRQRGLHVLDDAGVRRVGAAAEAGRALDEAGFDVTPDGATVVTGWWQRDGDPRDNALDLVALDVERRQRRVLARGHAWHEQPAVAPDGTRAVCVRMTLGTRTEPSDVTLWLVDLSVDDGGRDLLPDVDLRPSSAVWTLDSSGVLFTADDDGLQRPFRVDVATGTVTRLAGDASFEHLCPTAEGDLYAIRHHVDVPPHVAVLRGGATGDADPDGWEVVADPAGVRPAGRLERVETTAQDGARVPGWLVLPEGAGADDPAPLVVLVHGGPVYSWNGWHWRWSPHVLSAAGYAVVLPDPALSTGYGQDHLRRGWGRWGDAPYTDVLALTDAVEARPDIDAQRTALAGGSFGGYMANWVAGHTDRFQAIVTHASLWNLEAFHGTTDLGPWWEHEFGDRYREPEAYREWSPHRFVERISTPMLVIHGERDYRVPISEALMLTTDLARHGVTAPFLYFPDEHHWVLKPQNARLWYATMLAFLDHHVRGAAFAPPALLGGAAVGEPQPSKVRPPHEEEAK